MVSINLSLSESLEQFLDERVAEAGLQSREQYVEQLLRAEQKRLAKAKLDAMLLAGLDSGEPIPVDDEWWERKTQEAVARYHRKRNGGGDSP